MPLLALGDDIKNPSYITPFAIIHLLGAIIGYIYMKLLFPDLSNVTIVIIYFILHTLYEINDIYHIFYRLWYDVSISNSIGDTLFTIIGLYIAYRYLNGLNIYEIIIGTIIFMVMNLLFWGLQIG